MEGKSGRKGDRFIKRSKYDIQQDREQKQKQEQKQEQNQEQYEKRSPRAYFSDSLEKKDREGSVDCQSWQTGEFHEEDQGMVNGLVCRQMSIRKIELFCDCI